MAHAFAVVYLHIVFSTRDRIPFLSEPNVREETHRYLGGVASHHDAKAILVGGVEDHVHVLVEFGRTVSISELVRDLKRASSKWIKTQGPPYQTFSWQSGYAAFSVSRNERDQVIDYIANQEQHHRRWSFEEEYRHLLIEGGIEPDERYIWE